MLMKRQSEDWKSSDPSNARKRQLPASLFRPVNVSKTLQPKVSKISTSRDDESENEDESSGFSRDKITYTVQDSRSIELSSSQMDVLTAISEVSVLSTMFTSILTTIIGAFCIFYRCSRNWQEFCFANY